MNRKLPVTIVKTLGILLFTIIFITHPARILANSEFVKNSDAVFTPGPDYWNSYHVQNPSIFKLNGIYQMWYEANGGPGKRIGFAFSPDGVSNWTRNSSVSIAVGSSDGWEKETAEPFVMFNPITGYKMWYTSINTDHWPEGKDRFRLQYATSSGNITWNKYPEWSLYGTPGKWDVGGIYKGKSIIYDGEKYHLWYGGTNEDPLGANAYWGIGYATSTNGIHWEKQNQGNPVISPTSSEPKNASYPAVLYSYGLFHMFYGVGDSDDPNEIYYAYSVDGINWIRPTGINPLISTGPNSFDSLDIAPFTILLEGQTLKMWYSGYSSDGHWRIGYATASASILEGYTPTAGATPTPTDTPTPTPTPSPTPTPPTRKVIIIPGMTASWNLDAMINCKKDNYSGTWSLLGPAKDIYNPLVQALTKAGWQVTMFPYDWRTQIPVHTTELAALVHSQTTGSGKVDIVGHSMGGLLGRAYLESLQTNSKVEKLMTVGSPHQGAPLVYPAWSAGQIDHGDPTYRFMLTLLEKRCALKTHSDRLAIQEYFPGVQNLLPTFDYLTDNATNKVKPIASMKEQNNWLPTPFTFPFFGTVIGTLSGTGQTTTLGYRVTNASPADTTQGNWADGKPIQTLTTIEGDGTVPMKSEILDGAVNTTISETHTGLISSQTGISQIQQFLTSATPLAQANLLNTQTKPTNPQSPLISSSLYVIADPASFWIIDHHGKFITPTDGIIAVSNPKSEDYTLVIFPKSKETLLIIAQELGDKFFYKEYTLKNPFPKIKFIHFDTKHPKEDIFR